MPADAYKIAKPRTRSIPNAGGPALPGAPGVEAISHYTITARGVGLAVTEHRPGQPIRTTLCKSRGEANRLATALSSQGLVGRIMVRD